MSLSKNVLFYSRFCQYSNEVVSILTKKDLRSRFVMVCVDNNREQLPGFVDRVPLILTSDRHILADDNVFRYLDVAETPSVDPVAAESIGGLTGDFAFLDGTSPQGDGVFGFTTFGSEPPPINTPPDDSLASAKSKQDSTGSSRMGLMGGDGWNTVSGGGGGGSLEGLLAAREHELNAWRQHQGA